MSAHLFVFTPDEIPQYPHLFEWSRLFQESQESEMQLECVSSDAAPIHTEDDLCSTVSTLRKTEAACHSSFNATTSYFNDHSEEIRTDALRYLSAPERPILAKNAQRSIADMDAAMVTVLNSFLRPSTIEPIKESMHRFLCYLNDAFTQVKREPTINAVARMTILQQMRETLVSACIRESIPEADVGLSLITPNTIIMTIYAEMPEQECGQFLYMAMQFLFHYRAYSLFVDM